MIHNRQFILSRDAHHIGDDWMSMRLKNGFILSYQKNLHYICNQDNSIVIIGDAWQVNKGERSPKEIIQSLETKEKLDLTYIDCCEESWNGRYVLITGDYISLDAVGAYGVYFTDETISSSISLICEVENRTAVYPDIKWGDFPDFVPGPQTPIYGVKRVMPSQRFNYVNHEISYRYFLNTVSTVNTVPVLLKELKSMFDTSLRNMYVHFGMKPIWLALTGGKDSRTALVFLKRIGIPFKTFTFVYSDASREDANIAHYVAARIGVEHHTIVLDESRLSSVLSEQYKAHTMMMNVDGESVQIPYGMYDDLQGLAHGDFLLLRNNAWESIMDYFSAFMDTPESMIDTLRAKGKNDNSIDEWMSWITNDSLNADLSMWDRIFWEQREGCWLSTIEQSLEMIEPMTSVQMCNCRRILSYLHAFPYEMRRNKAANVELINSIQPTLRYIPFNGELHTNEPVWRGMIRKRYPELWRVMKACKNKLTIND